MGLTQKEFAKLIGTNDRNLQYYESGDRKPSLETFIALLDRFDISADYLLGRTSNKNSHKDKIFAEPITKQDNLLTQILSEQSILKERMSELDKKIGNLKKLR